MKLQTYNDMTVDCIDRTPISREIIKFACDITMKKADDIRPIKADALLFNRLLAAGHTSVLEHSSMTILCKGISRSLLAQVTRQRHFSFTSASQHYQNYREYPMSIRPGTEPTPRGSLKVNQTYREALGIALNYYLELIELGEKPEEARQVLPNACTVNLLITANPRALAEFLQVRLCNRNTMEMQIFAYRLKQVCLHWIPELFKFIAPACVSTGQCDQGSMSCDRSLKK
jgi:thymidylate synthase (FAD)